MQRPAPRALAAVAIASSTVLLATTHPSALAAPGQDPSQQSRKFRQAVTPAGVAEHLDAFQQIADENDGNRASGTPGYDASKDYVVGKLRAAGYRPVVQTFDFVKFTEVSPSRLAQVDPDAGPYTEGEDFSIMEFSGSGNVEEAEVVAVDTELTATDASTSGCEAADFTGFPAGAIALMQRGACNFGVKAQHADDAGASAALIFNRGTPGNTGPIAGTLGQVLDIPVLGLDYETGVDLGTPAGTTASVFTETTNVESTTYNVLAETRKGDPDNVVMAGAHLDSTDEGPGINDNGSGSAAILEVAEQLAKQKKLTNKVRFAWWGAEESGLVGATHYVYDMYDNNPEALGDIAMYLNFDMIGSPNFVRFVYDGDNSLGTGFAGPEGSAQLESLFTDYFASQGLASEPTEFNGRSDYGPFLDAGIASGGLFTGAEGLKTAEQAVTYGGEAGEPYDPCYHQACDDRKNVSEAALDQMSDAVAHAVFVLSQSTALVNGEGKVRGPKASADKSATMKGHQSVR